MTISYSFQWIQSYLFYAYWPSEPALTYALSRLITTMHSFFHITLLPMSRVHIITIWFSKGHHRLFLYRSSGLVLERPPCNRETGVQIPVESHQRLLKMGPIASLLGAQHKGLEWGVNSPHDSRARYAAAHCSPRCKTWGMG